MELIALVATVLAAIFLIPQVMRLVTTGDSRGVSATWAGLGVVTNLAWVTYLWRQGLWAPALAPGIAVITYGVSVTVISRIHPGRVWVRSSVVYALVIAATGIWGGMAALGLLLAVTPLIQVAPELAAVFRESHPSGVSPAAWALAAAEAVLWGIYGWLAGDLALVGYGVLTAAAAFLILARWTATHPRRSMVHVVL